jgi:hypothetical protein
MGVNLRVGKRGSVASLAALASVFTAGSCCLPLGTIALTAGASGGAVLVSRAQPFLMPAALGFLAVAFWQTYRKKPSCARRPIAGQIVLWISAAVVIGFLLFPQWVALLALKLGG